MECAKRFFDVPVEEKLQIDKSIIIRVSLRSINCSVYFVDLNTFNRGYKILRSQMLEARTGPEFKRRHVYRRRDSRRSPLLRAEEVE
jgi:hypothetical protein